VGEYKVTATRFNNLAARSTARGHEVISGESQELGGDDEGLNPYELILSALSSCTIITCQMYANRKTWPLDRTEVECRIAEIVDGKATIERRIKFVGQQLTDEQRARLLEIANKCPVHKFLSHVSEIQTTPAV